MLTYSSSRFQKEFELKVDKEFEFNGVAATWAPGQGGPRIWGEEDESITLPDEATPEDQSASNSTALTPDCRFLAISSNSVIRIYDVETLAQCSEIIGHNSHVQAMIFAPNKQSSQDREWKYVLYSLGTRVRGDGGQILAWKFGDDGKLDQSMTTMPFAVKHYADRAIDSIDSDLRTHHDLDEADIEAIHDGFLDVLNSADARNRVKHVPSLDGGFASFNRSLVSHDGTLILYTAHGQTTQQKMRPAEELPQIVVLRADTTVEVCRLKGHSDAIMWAGWSPDDKTIATASWDGTYKIWSSETGECRHTIGRTDGQNWAGAFLPDGKHLILSGAPPVQFAVYEIETANEVRRLESDGTLKLDHWLRYFAINPNDSLLVLQNSIQILAWNLPLDVPRSAPPREKPHIEELFAFACEGDQWRRRYIYISSLDWCDDGKKLIAQSSENTTFVWDVAKNLKWRFQRPQGLSLKHGYRAHFVIRRGGEWIVCVDGDGKVRLWKL